MLSKEEVQNIIDQLQSLKVGKVGGKGGAQAAANQAAANKADQRVSKSNF
jgi:hypothetical protein